MNDEWWRTTAHCDKHGVQQMQVIESMRKSHNKESIIVIGYLVCGDRFKGAVVSQTNAAEIQKLRWRRHAH